MQILVTSFHINQEIIKKTGVSSVTLGENKSSKIQKPLYLPKPKHQSVQPLHIRRAIQEQFFICMLHWLLHGVGRFLEQVCLSTISGIHHSIKQMVFPQKQSQQVLYEIRYLPLAIESDRKPGFIPLGCATSQRHSTARVPITQ